MRRLLPFLAGAAILGAGSGCHYFSRRKPRPPKESPAIAVTVEKEFEQRWVAKRVSDLAAAGLDAPAAQAQALQEFRAKFRYTGIAQQPLSSP